MDTKDTTTAPGTPEMVLLKAKDKTGEDIAPKEFEISRANKLLSLHNSQWELVADKGYTWNGKDLAKTAENAEETAKPKK